MNYYISDLHFGHKNVLKHDSRPFDSIDKMNRVLISNWNAKVQDKDDMRKYLIVGNHDKVTLNR